MADSISAPMCIITAENSTVSTVMSQTAHCGFFRQIVAA